MPPSEQQHVAQFDTDRHIFFEVALGPTSPLVSHTLKGVGFRGRYQAAVVAIDRRGRPDRDRHRGDDRGRTGPFAPPEVATRPGTPGSSGLGWGVNRSGQDATGGRRTFL